MILAPDPAATAPGKEVKELTEPKGEISEANGFNCTQRSLICVPNKVGVITMRRDAEDEAGNPIPYTPTSCFRPPSPGRRLPPATWSRCFPGAVSTSQRIPPT